MRRTPGNDAGFYSAWPGSVRARARFLDCEAEDRCDVPKGGDPVTVEFTAPTAGRYEIACSEFCGSGHGQMKAALVSVGPTQTSR